MAMESRRYHLPATLLALVLLSLSVQGQDAPRRARLVEYGWDCPDTAYARAHAAEMERQPFDGVTISVRDPLATRRDTGSILGWRCFGRERFKPEQYQPAIDDLRATRFKKFKANFIPLVSNPGTVDWFDPDWEKIIHNVRCLAQVAKQGGCIGILFDPEQYGHSLWTYRGLSEGQKNAHSFDEYAAMARQRGQEFIRAVNEEFPDISILTLYGPSLPVMGRKRLARHEGPADGTYSLLPIADCELRTADFKKTNFVSIRNRQSEIRNFMARHRARPPTPFQFV